MASTSTSKSVWPVFVLGVFLIALFWGITALVRSWGPAGSNEEAEKGLVRMQNLAELQTQNGKELAGYAWADKEKGLVRIPIKRAMELEVAALNEKKPQPAYPIATPAAAPAESPEAAPESAPAESPESSPASEASPEGASGGEAGYEGSDASPASRMPRSFLECAGAPALWMRAWGDFALGGAEVTVEVMRQSKAAHSAALQSGFAAANVLSGQPSSTQP